MTDAEVTQTIEEIETAAKAIKEDTRRRRVLLLRRETLKRVQAAREKNDRTMEMKATLDYTLLTSLGEKHPFLMMFMKSKFGWSPF